MAPRFPLVVDCSFYSRGSSISVKWITAQALATDGGEEGTQALAAGGGEEGTQALAAGGGEEERRLNGSDVAGASHGVDSDGTRDTRHASRHHNDQPDGVAGDYN